MRTPKLLFTIFCFLFLASNQLDAQHLHQNIETSAHELFKEATKESPLILKFKDIPNYCFGHRRPNPFMKFNDEQLNVMSDYSYPKFISTGYNNLETDIMKFQEQLELWNKTNADRIEEINEALGLTQ